MSPTYVGLFYALLALWTGVAVPLIVAKASVLGSVLFLMVSFFIAYTWYWSLGISYRIRLCADGSVEFTSVRRHLQVHSREIAQVEGPPIPICFGFMRFRLEREKVYLFFGRNRALQQILSDMRAANPSIRFKSLSAKMLQPG